MLANFSFLLLILFTGCSFPEPSKKLTKEEMFKKERDKRIYSALKKFIKNMKAKGYRAAGIGEGIDHSTGKQNYLAVTFDIERLPTITFARKVEVEEKVESSCNAWNHFVDVPGAIRQLCSRGWAKINI